MSIFRTVFTGLIVPPAQAASLQTDTTKSRSPLHICGMSASRMAEQLLSVSINQQFRMTSAVHSKEARHPMKPSEGPCPHVS